MNVHDDLQLEWANIDGEGLVRVYPTEGFHNAFALVAHIGQAAEQIEYYPEILLTATKVTVTIPEDKNGFDHHLAHAIDDALHNAVA